MRGVRGLGVRHSDVCPSPLVVLGCQRRGRDRAGEGPAFGREKGAGRRGRGGRRGLRGRQGRLFGLAPFVIKVVLKLRGRRVPDRSDQADGVQIVRRPRGCVLEGRGRRRGARGGPGGRDVFQLFQDIRVQREREHPLAAAQQRAERKADGRDRLGLGQVEEGRKESGTEERTGPARQERGADPDKRQARPVLFTLRQPLHQLLHQLIPSLLGRTIHLAHIRRQCSRTRVGHRSCTRSSLQQRDERRDKHLQDLVRDHKPSQAPPHRDDPRRIAPIARQRGDGRERRRQRIDKRSVKLGLVRGRNGERERLVVPQKELQVGEDEWRGLQCALPNVLISVVQKREVSVTERGSSRI